MIKFVILLFALIFIVPYVLYRAVILFPAATLRTGWRPALKAYKFSLALTAALLVYEAGNLTGASWSRLTYVSEAELIQAAIRYAYPRIYADLASLRADYPGFAPQVRYWGSWNMELENTLSDKLIGFTRYQVKLPELLVMVDTDGKARMARGCDNDPCWAIAPAHPEFGIIGTVQLEIPTGDIVTDFRLDWKDGARNELFRAGHCFSAYRDGSLDQSLTISTAATRPLEIRARLGFYLIAARLKPKSEQGALGGSYGQMRITREEFLKWKSCSDAAKQDWPNVGGGGWKR